MTACYDAIKTSIGSLVGDRVFELQAPQDEPLPLCVFQIVTDVIIHGLTCDTEEAILQVDFYGEQKLGSEDIRTISDSLEADLRRGNLGIASDNPSIETVSDTVYTTEKGVTTVEGGKVIRIRQEYLIRIT